MFALYRWRSWADVKVFSKCSHLLKQIEQMWPHKDVVSVILRSRAIDTYGLWANFNSQNLLDCLFWVKGHPAFKNFKLSLVWLNVWVWVSQVLAAQQSRQLNKLQEGSAVVEEQLLWKSSLNSYIFTDCQICGVFMHVRGIKRRQEAAAK